MKLEDFIEQYSGAPYMFDEWAVIASKVEDCPVLVDRAIEYLNSLDIFIAELTQYVEMG